MNPAMCLETEIRKKTIFQETGKHKEVLRRKNERPGSIYCLKQASGQLRITHLDHVGPYMCCPWPAETQPDPEADSHQIWHSIWCTWTNTLDIASGVRRIGIWHRHTWCTWDNDRWDIASGVHGKPWKGQRQKLMDFSHRYVHKSIPILLYAALHFNYWVSVLEVPQRHPILSFYRSET